MKTQYYTASSLDGFIADEHHDLDWLLQFDSGGEGGAPKDWDAFIRHVGAVAMGRTTYEWVVAHLEKANPGNPGAWPYTQPSWVFSSRTLKPVPGGDIRFVKGDVRPVHAEMVQAAKGKNVWIVGGGDLVGQFHDAGLLDELIVTFASVTLGRGAPLLPRRIVTPPLRLVSAERWGDGFAQLRYEVGKGRG